MKRLAFVLWFLMAPLMAYGAEAALPKGLMVLSGKPAPALELSDMDGKLVKLSDSRGKWTMVHFWASWCGPCRKEMPTIQSMMGKIPKDRLALLLVNTSEGDDQVFTFMATVAPDLTALMDRDGTVTERWQPRGLPSTFLIDPQGNLRYLALGGRTWDSPPYLTFIESLIQQDSH
jgi:thiol-disulfide isomerase/thioredoxin